MTEKDNNKNILFNKKQLLLYAVTNREGSCKNGSYEEFYRQIDSALRGGVTCLQLREKNLSREEFIKEAVCVKKVCSKYGVPLIINDNVDVALESGADGVHVGIEDAPVDIIRKRVGKNFIIGATAKTAEQAQKAESDGADYIGVGAVFPSPTKQNAIRITLKELREICGSVSIPAVAIGGISRANINSLFGCGACGAALVSAVFSADDIYAQCRALREIAEKIFARKIKTALSIAGSDSSGGAGIQADIKTMLANGVYAMSAITALTAQNTKCVSGIYNVTPEFLKLQIDAVFDDIRPDAVKIGMVSSGNLIKTISDRLRFYAASDIVADPVMVATSGAKLIEDDAVEVLKREILPIAAVLTPNIPETEILSGQTVNSPDDMIFAAEKISRSYGCAVLCKGGHNLNDANDLLYLDGSYKWFEGKRIDNPNTHGTGCTLSSAIAANLAKGFDIAESVKRAKKYISGALGDMLDIGSGSGPMNHGYDIKSEFAGNT